MPAGLAYAMHAKAVRDVDETACRGSLRREPRQRRKIARLTSLEHVAVPFHILQSERNPLRAEQLHGQQFPGLWTDRKRILHVHPAATVYCRLGVRTVAGTQVWKSFLALRIVGEHEEHGVRSGLERHVHHVRVRLYADIVAGGLLEESDKFRRAPANMPLFKRKRAPGCGKEDGCCKYLFHFRRCSPFSCFKNQAIPERRILSMAWMQSRSWRGRWKKPLNLLPL